MDNNNSRIYGDCSELFTDFLNNKSYILHNFNFKSFSFGEKDLVTSTKTYNKLKTNHIINNKFGFLNLNSPLFK